MLRALIIAALAMGVQAACPVRINIIYLLNSRELCLCACALLPRVAPLGMIHRLSNMTECSPRLAAPNAPHTNRAPLLPHSSWLMIYEA